MKQELLITGDGSHTLFVPELNEYYHSTFGAITESGVVFIDAGLKPALLKSSAINILEIGFGAGLNALLTYFGSIGKTIHYHAVEAFPLDQNIIEKLNYAEILASQNAGHIFRLLHSANWNEEQCIPDHFFLKKINLRIVDAILPEGYFDLVYFDAFGPEVQPELWTEAIFAKIGVAMKKNGILTTYSAKGEIRRNLKRAGFEVEKLPGPPGKRHITRAIKAD
jgi:tRNA U34 5-methylaminomethyl-2-thiouridine-forming methyltransferase MnmC